MISNNQLKYTELVNIISQSRLSTYNNDISLYIWNTKLSENFFFLLQNLEVGLRNAIYNAFLKQYPKQDFFYLFETNLNSRYLSKKEFHSRECWKMLCSVKYKLKKQNIKITQDKIIAELNFGFWTKILQDKHYSNLWRNIFEDVFPYKNITKSIDVSKYETAIIFNDLRVFRNRVFHYEPIFNKSPEIYHNNILLAIKWIDNNLYLISKTFDNFQSTLSMKEEIDKKLTKELNKNE